MHGSCPPQTTGVSLAGERRPDDTEGGRRCKGSNFLEAPARYNFKQAAIYRLKLEDIPRRPGLTLYPTLDVVPSNSKTATFLAHSAVAVRFTEDDFEQVAAGNYVVKVIYLPDPQFQDSTTAGLEEVNSSRLPAGQDPIQEARKHGSILVVIRVGNIDLENPTSPPLDAPSPYHGMPASMPRGITPSLLPEPSSVPAWANPDHEARLTAVEKKLSAVLQDLAALRKELRPVVPARHEEEASERWQPMPLARDRPCRW